MREVVISYFRSVIGLLPTYIMRGVAILADELDQLRVRHDTLVYLNSPRFGIGLGIIYGDLDFQIPIIRPTESFDNSRRIGQRTASHIEPTAICEAGRLHNESVSFPFSDRVSIPPRLRVLPWQRPSIGEYLPKPTVCLVDDDDHIGCRNNLPRLGMIVKLQETHR